MPQARAGPRDRSDQRIFEPDLNAVKPTAVAYAEDDIRAVLGEPADDGYIDHPMAASHAIAWARSSWGVIADRRSQPDRFRKRDCLGVETRLDRAEYFGKFCLALRPMHGPKADQGWFVVHLCTKHEGGLSETAFQELLADPIPNIAPVLLIVDEQSFERKAGPDWDRIQALRQAGKQLTGVQRDEQLLPGKLIVLLEVP